MLRVGNATVFPTELHGIQQQLPPSSRKTAHKSVSSKVYGESDREQGEERAFDGVWLR